MTESYAHLEDLDKKIRHVFDSTPITIDNLYLFWRLAMLERVEKTIRVTIPNEMFIGYAEQIWRQNFDRTIWRYVKGLKGLEKEFSNKGEGLLMSNIGYPTPSTETYIV